GENKAEAERLLGRTGMAVASLRYFNAAGAEPAAGLGEAHRPETHLLPLAVEAAVRGTALTVYGHDWETPDGTCVRDYVHVSDRAMYRHKSCSARPLAEVLEDVAEAGRRMPDTRRVFLLDGDAMTLSTARLMPVLEACAKAFPRLARVGSYVNAVSVLGKSDED